MDVKINVILAHTTLYTLPAVFAFVVVALIYKWIENRGSGLRIPSILGARATHYLLEKSRVIKQASNERNFHIFYELTAGASRELKTKLFLQDAYPFVYLSESECDRDDVHQFRRLQDAFNVVGLTPAEQEGTFRFYYPFHATCEQQRDG